MARRLRNADKKKIVLVFKPKIVKCGICKKEFEVKPSAKFKRKYCKECSKKNKEYYDNLDSITIEDCEED